MGLTAALGEWRSTTMANGGKFVIITGAMNRLQWCVRNFIVDLRKNTKKLSTLVIVDWEGIQVDALAMWALSPNANFKKSQGHVKVFPFHVQVRHKSRNMLLWEFLLPKVSEGSIDRLAIFYMLFIIYKSPVLVCLSILVDFPVCGT